jgi:hypothetical protein
LECGLPAIRLRRGRGGWHGIGDEERADRRSNDNDKFDRLDQSFNMSPHHDEAANDAYDNCQAANDNQHLSSPRY